MRREEEAKRQRAEAERKQAEAEAKQKAERVKEQKESFCAKQPHTQVRTLPRSSDLFVP